LHISEELEEGLVFNVLINVHGDANANYPDLMIVMCCKTSRIILCQLKIKGNSR
jgi:hypothetical protein